MKKIIIFVLLVLCGNVLGQGAPPVFTKWGQSGAFIFNKAGDSAAVIVGTDTTWFGANVIRRGLDTVSMLGPTIEGDELGTGLLDSITDGKTAYGWDDHSAQGYVDTAELHDTADVLRAEMGAGTGGWTDQDPYIILEAIGDSVGIGTASPDAKLHVDGDVIIDGRIDSLTAIYGKIGAGQVLSITAQTWLWLGRDRGYGVQIYGGSGQTVPAIEIGDTGGDDSVFVNAHLIFQDTNDIIGVDKINSDTVDIDNILSIGGNNLSELVGPSLDDSNGVLIVKDSGVTVGKIDHSDAETNWLDALYQPLEATLTDMADGTVNEALTFSGNMVNTANPWADNEVADNITVDEASDVDTTGTKITAALGTRMNNTGDTVTGTYDFSDGDIEDVENIDVDTIVTTYAIRGDKAVADSQYTTKKYVDDNIAAAGGGDVTDVVGGNGLIDDGNTGSITLDVRPGSGIDTVGDLVIVDTNDLNANWKIATALSADQADTAVTSADEKVQDKAGAMVSGNTETQITVTYQDADGTIDFVLDDPVDSADGAERATKDVDANVISTTYMKRSGALAVTGNQNWGDNNLTNVEIGSFDTINVETLGVSEIFEIDGERFTGLKGTGLINDGGDLSVSLTVSDTVVDSAAVAADAWTAHKDKDGDTIDVSTYLTSESSDADSLVGIDIQAKTGNLQNDYILKVDITAADTTLQWEVDAGGGGSSAEILESDVSKDDPLVILNLMSGFDVNVANDTSYVTLDLTEDQVDLTAEVTGTLPVNKGGTGVATITDGGVLYGNGTSPIGNSGVLGNGMLLIGDGSGAPTAATLTADGGIDISNGAGSITIGANGQFDGNVSINYDGPDGDGYLYFYNASDPTDKYLRWIDDDGGIDYFVINDRLQVSGALWSDSSIRANGDLYVNNDHSAHEPVIYFALPASGSKYIKWNTTNDRFEFQGPLWAAGSIITDTDSNITAGGSIRAYDEVQADNGLFVNYDNSDADAVITFKDGDITATFHLDDANNQFESSHGLDLIGGNFDVSSGNITLSGTVDGVDLDALNTDVAGDTGSWNATADALGTSIDSNKIDFTTMDEWVSDQIIAHLGGTETGIAVTGQDGTNDIDFVVDADIRNHTLDTTEVLDILRDSISGDGTVGAGGALTISANAVESTMIGADQVNDLDINFGAGTDQVNSDDLPAHTGDVTGGTALTIAANAVESTMIGVDQVNDLDINFGAGTDQVNSDDLPAHTGDVTGGTALTIAANAVESTMIGADEVNDLDINFGTGTDQVSATDLPDFGTMTATDDNILVADGTDFESVAMSGDGTMNNGVLDVTFADSTGAVYSGDVIMDTLSAPTYSTLEHWFDLQSATIISGGAITQDVSDSTVIDITAGTGIVKITDSDIGENLFFDFSSGNDVAVANNTELLVYVDYNGGSPILATTAAASVTFTTQVVLGRVYRAGNHMHITQGGQNFTNFMVKNSFMMYEIYDLRRGSGLVTSEGADASNDIDVSSGAFYLANNRQALSAVASFTDGIELWYGNGSGGFTAYDTTALNDVSYDDGDGTRAALTTNRYNIFWIFIETDGELIGIYDSVIQSGGYSLGAAEAEVVVTTLPPHIHSSAVFIAKIIVQEGAGIISIEYPWTVTFTGALTADHGNLAGLGDDDHTQYLKESDTSAYTATILTWVQTEIEDSLNEYSLTSAIASTYFPLADADDSIAFWLRDKIASNNVQTRITLTYQSADSTIDFVVDDMTWVVSDSESAIEAVVDHDDLQGVTANEHIDWTGDQGATNIHSGNIDTVPFSHHTRISALWDFDLNSFTSDRATDSIVFDTTECDTTMGVHPDVEATPNGWPTEHYDGDTIVYSRRLYMIQTPSYQGCQENPTIYWSDDKTNWYRPFKIDTLSGDTIYVPVPLCSFHTGGLNTDPQIVIGHDGDMYAFWRWKDGDGVDSTENIYVKSSSNAINWGDSTLLFSTDKTTAALSPAVLFDDDNYYRMWTIDKDSADNVIRLELSATPTGFDYAKTTLCTLSNIPSNWYVWHLNVAKAGGLYVMVATMRNAGDYKNWLAKSYNGLNWTFSDSANVLTEGSGISGAFDKSFVYTGDIVPRMTPNGYVFDYWYTGNLFAGVPEFNIGYTTIEFPLAGLWTKTGTNLSPTTAGDDILLNTGETFSIADMTTGSVPFIGASGLFSQDNANLFWDDANNRFGIGINSPSSIFHIKADVPGVIGSHSGGQLIIQNPTNSVFSNAVITGYESDAAGNPDQQLWYFGSASGSNSDITMLNRRASSLHLGTNGTTRLTIDSDGKVGIGTLSPPERLSVVGNIATGDTATGDVDVYHYFSTNGSWITEYLKWDDGLGRFIFSNALAINNILLSNDSISGVDVITADSVVVNGDIIKDFTGSNLSVTAGVLNATGGNFVWQDSAGEPPFWVDSATYAVRAETASVSLLALDTTIDPTFIGHVTVTGQINQWNVINKLDLTNARAEHAADYLKLPQFYASWDVDDSAKCVDCDTSFQLHPAFMYIPTGIFTSSRDTMENGIRRFNKRLLGLGPYCMGEDDENPHFLVKNEYYNWHEFFVGTESTWECTGGAQEDSIPIGFKDSTANNPIYSKEDSIFFYSDDSSSADSSWDLDAANRHCSDQALFLGHDRKLYMPYRGTWQIGGTDTHIVAIGWTTNGYEWSTPRAILSHGLCIDRGDTLANAYWRFMSPTILVDTGQTYEMWTVERQGEAPASDTTFIVKWEAPMPDSGWRLVDTCHYVGTEADAWPWHMRVKRRGLDELYAFISEYRQGLAGDSAILVIAVSYDDGMTWTATDTVMTAGTDDWNNHAVYLADGAWVDDGGSGYFELYVSAKGVGHNNCIEQTELYFEPEYVTADKIGDTADVVRDEIRDTIDIIDDLDSANVTANALSMSGDMHTFTKAELEARSTDVADYAEADGDTWSGTHNLGEATSFELPNSDNPTGVNLEGRIAWENDDHCLRVNDGSATRSIPSTKFFSASIFNPELVQDTIDAIAILPVEPEWAPFGIKLLDVGIKTDAASSYSVNFEEWTSPTDGSPSTIETVATSSSTEAEDDGTLSDSDIAAGSIIYIDLPDTDIKMLQIWGTYYIKTGD